MWENRKRWDFKMKNRFLPFLLVCQNAKGEHFGLVRMEPHKFSKSNLLDRTNFLFLEGFS